MRVLVVDDSSSMRELLRQQLQERGHSVAAVASGEEGLEEHRRQPFDLMLIDWALPGMSGPDLCRQVRSLPGGDSVVILVVTARDRPEDLKAALDAGASDYLSKPVSPEVLRARLLVCERRAGEHMQRRRVELALKITEGRLRSIAENLPGVVFRCRQEDEGLRFTFVSKGVQELFGASAEEVLGDPAALLRLVPDAARPGLRAAFEASARDLTPLAHELRTVGSDGDRWYRLIATPTRSEGRVVWDGQILDITPLKRAQEALRRSEESLRQLIDKSPDSILVHRDRRFVYVNPRLLQLLGYSDAEELMDRSILEVIHPDDHPLVDERHRQVEDGQRTAAQEIRLLRADGTAVRTECIALPIEHAGSPAVLVVARDVRDRAG